MNTEYNELVSEINSIINGTYKVKPLDLKSMILQAELNDAIWLPQQVNEMGEKLDKFSALATRVKNS